MDPDAVVERAYAFLRGHYAGELRFDERLGPVRYVVGPDGTLVVSAEAHMLDATDTVLFVPRYEEGAMELSVTLQPIDPDGPSGALVDRWRIHHGEPLTATWALLEIDAARFEGSVLDGAALKRPNPLAGVEAALCREINGQRRGDLRTLCRHFARADVEAPLLVGVDPGGFDVRRRFDVVRIVAPVPMEDAEGVRRILQQMIAAATAGPGARRSG
jgi:hypothetical protein